MKNRRNRLNITSVSIATMVLMAMVASLLEVYAQEPCQCSVTVSSCGCDGQCDTAPVSCRNDPGQAPTDAVKATPCSGYNDTLTRRVVTRVPEAFLPGYDQIAIGRAQPVLPQRINRSDNLQQIPLHIASTILRV